MTAFNSPGFTSTITTYPFGVPGSNGLGEWFEWVTSSGPLVLDFTTSTVPISSVWIPVITTSIRFYEGTPTSGLSSVFYTTQSSGSELVDVPSGQQQITLEASTGATMYVFVSSLPFNPFRTGPTTAQVASVTATYPITSTGGTNPVIGLTVPLPVVDGGTGVTNPSLVGGTGVTISGTWPDQTVSATTAGTVTDVSADSPLSSTHGSTPTISIANPIPLDLGGTAQTAPALNGGTGITVSGTIFQPGGGSAWTVSNDGVITLNGQAGGVNLVAGANISLTGIVGGNITINAPDAVIGNSSGLLQHGKVTTSGGTATVTLPTPYTGSVPTVVCNPLASIGNFWPSIGSSVPITTFTINVNGGDCAFDWIAIGAP